MATMSNVARRILVAGKVLQRFQVTLRVKRIDINLFEKVSYLVYIDWLRHLFWSTTTCSGLSIPLKATNTLYIANLNGLNLIPKPRAFFDYGSSDHWGIDKYSCHVQNNPTPMLGISHKISKRNKPCNDKLFQQIFVK